MTIYFSDLPEDAIPEILLRSPVKSLLRFKTVCKLWLSIISDPQFIQSHSRIAAQKKSSILVNKQSLDVTPKYFEYVFLPKGIDRDRDIYVFVGSVKGIVCFKDYNLIYLWNPSMRRYRRIPNPKKCSSVFTTFGFGYDSISNDFKLVCLGSNYTNHTKQMQLFSKNGGVWRKIQVHIPLPYGIYAKCQHINGVLYFEHSDSENELISFDLHNELFGVLPLPHFVQGKRSEILDFKGSPALIYMDSIGDGLVNQDISLWILQESAEVSWTKKFTIEAADLCWVRKPLFPYGLWVDLYLGDGIFYGRNYFHGDPGKNPISHMWYNYEKKEGNCIDIPDGQFPSILNYTESLFWFKSTAVKKSDVVQRELKPNRNTWTIHEKWATWRGLTEGPELRTWLQDVKCDYQDQTRSLVCHIHN